MPDNDHVHSKRTLSEENDFPPNPRAPFVELGLATCFSFLRGASDAVDLVTTAHALGYDTIGVADRNSLAGVVRVHVEARKASLRPVIGCRIVLLTSEEFLAYPATAPPMAASRASCPRERCGTWTGNGNSRVSAT
jgi:error-prone DNA polymerase